MKSITKIVLLLLVSFIAVNTIEAKKKKYPNGDYYVGEWKKGKPHGKGKMIYANGNFYDGIWLFGKKSDQGTMKYSNGDLLKGKWENDSIREGVMMFSNGSIYEGYWKNGEPSGLGKYTDKNNNMFEGYFISGIPERGKLVYKDGDYCEGIFTASSMNNGPDLEKSCSLIEGTCNRYIKINNERFIGTIIDGKYKEGKIIQSNNGWFEGKWDEKIFTGKSDGWYEGNYYKGVWNEGRFTGEFILKQPSSDKYVSSFKGEILDGKVIKGNVKFKNGLIYEGNLKENSNSIQGRSIDYLPLGKGKLFVSSASTDIMFTFQIEGDWEDGKLVKIDKANVLVDDISYDLKLIEGNLAFLYKHDNDFPIKVSNYYTEIFDALNKEISIAYNTIKMNQPGILLSHVSVNRLTTIKELRIIGNIDETDLEIINKMRNLRYLDLSRASLTFSEKEKNNVDGEQFVRDFLGFFVGIIPDDEDESTKYSGIIPVNFCRGLRFLQTIKFPKNTRVIGGSTCENCINLTQVEFPDCLERINACSFGNCTSLTEINLPASLKFLGHCGMYENKCVFYDCISLRKIDLSKCTFEDLEWRCDFEGCTNLKELYLPNGIEVIKYTPRNKQLHVHIPPCVEILDKTFYDNVLYFKATVAPKAKGMGYVHSPRRCIIYIPKGSITSYYSEFGAENEYIEEF